MTTPYELAWQAYHRYGVATWEWPVVVGLHFQHGLVLSTPEAFLMARLVNRDDPPEFHFSPLQSRTDGDCWMIWIAAGKMSALCDLWAHYPAPWVSYNRGTDITLRFLNFQKFLKRHGKHACTESPTSTAAATAAGGRHWLGEANRTG